MKFSITPVLVGVTMVACSAAPDATVETSHHALESGTGALVGLAGKCLAANGTRVQLWTCTGADTQTWTYDSANSTLVTGGMCLDLRRGRTANGTLVQLSTCNGSDAQKWTFDAGRVIGKRGKCLDVPAFATDDGTPIEIWDCNGGANQQWTFQTTSTSGTDAGTSGGDTTDAADGGTTSSGGNGGPGPVAARANDFLESIGVNAHLGQGVDAPDATAQALAYAGFRALRDVGDAAMLTQVAQQSGVRIDYLLYASNSVADDLKTPTTLAQNAVLLSIEGPNEPNNFPVTYGGQTSSYTGTFAPVANYQRDVYAAVKASPVLANVPVFHSSEAGGSEPDNVGLQWLTIPENAGTTMPPGTRYADYANTHNYVCGHSNQLVDNIAWNASDPTLNGDWDGLYVEYGHTWHGGFAGYSNADLVTLPRVTTETGWETQGSGSISEEAQGRLFLNLYAAAFKRGWSYTFIYMLHDDPVQGYWGLFDVNYQPKKSAVYLHNLTTILADRGSGTPGTLDYSLANPPATVHDLLLQKSTGAFELVVWNERPSGGQDTVTVTFGSSKPAVRIYDPTVGTTPVDQRTDVTSVSLTLTDHPVVLEL